MILSYLQAEDMNSVACSSRAFPEARNHSSLDQARSATFVCKAQTTMDNLYKAIIKGNWNRVFTGNRTHLRIKNFANIQEREWHDPRDTTSKIRRRAVLSGVRSLEVSSDRATNQQMASYSTFYDLFSILPGVLEINLNQLSAFKTKQCFSFGSALNRCPKFKRIKWNGPMCLHLHGGRGSSNLSELYLNGCVFLELRNWIAAYASNLPEARGVYMMVNCTRLQRLSIKNACLKPNMHNRKPYRVPQAIIIKMVRNHPTLRWLRSDLTKENVAMLQRERPDISFVTE